MSGDRYLSKTRYIAGNQCLKRLWLEVNDPKKIKSISGGQKWLFEGGTGVGIQARTYFPEGILIDASDLQTALKETEEALADKATVIFEATFCFQKTYAIVDILNKDHENNWNIIEVKSSTRVKSEHLEDLALQKYILQKSGFPVAKTKLMHINKHAVYPNFANLFNTVDVSAEVDKLVEIIPEKLTSFKEIIKQKMEPEVLIGPQCDKPYPCPFKPYCWQDVDHRTIFDIPKLSRKEKQELRRQNMITLEDIPSDYPLTDFQWAHVKRVLNDRIDIETDQIAKKLAALTYPLYFLDFETDNSAIPKFRDAHPYQKIPFQYSCHIIQADGNMTHCEYLHIEDSDPRLSLTEALVQDIGPVGSVIAYNAGFEKRVIQDLAAYLPEYAEPLQSIAERLWDQLQIFKYHYHHPEFGKSNSIKRVLPVVVSGLNYEDLAVQKGDEAISAWNKLIKTQPGPEKDRLIADLKTYCQMDTMAMVELQRVLYTLIKDES